MTGTDQLLTDWLSFDYSTVLNTLPVRRENVTFLQAAPANLAFIPLRVVERRPEDVTLYYGMPTVCVQAFNIHVFPPDITSRDLHLRTRLAPRTLLGQAFPFTGISIIQVQRPRTRRFLTEQISFPCRCQKIWEMSAQMQHLMHYLPSVLFEIRLLPSCLLRAARQSLGLRASGQHMIQ